MEQLAQLYRLDKEISSGYHDYIPVYKLLFGLRKDTINTLLEIGIGCVEKNQMTHVSRFGYKTGNGARMWRDYFTNANIYALDINPEAMILNEPRITTYTADQSNYEHLETICNEIKVPLDIVIDDGSHNYAHQVASFVFLEKYLGPNAIYCIEDVHQTNVQKLQEMVGFPETIKAKIANTYDRFVFDRRRQYPFLEDDIIYCYVKK
jgi:hypothetical protein